MNRRDFLTVAAAAGMSATGTCTSARTTSGARDARADAAAAAADADVAVRPTCLPRNWRGSRS